MAPSPRILAPRSHGSHRHARLPVQPVVTSRHAQADAELDAILGSIWARDAATFEAREQEAREAAKEAQDRADAEADAAALHEKALRAGKEF